jgi:prepilin-type N-terminal cleavage/methylation domain-containing protein
MLKFLRSKKGFTLVELMVVCIIVAILAAVAIPLMSANKRRAYATEAQAAIGMINSAMRVYYSDHDHYPTSAEASEWGTATHTNVLGIRDADLLGNFFSSTNYAVAVTGTDAAGTYVITCDWNATNTAPAHEDVNIDASTIFTSTTGAFTSTGY